MPSHKGKKEKQVEHINELVENLFNTFTENDVIRVVGRKMFFQGKELSESVRKEIINGADAITNITTWNMLLMEMKWLANQRIYFHAKDIDDILFGKAMLYTIDILEKKLKNLSNLK